MMKNILKLIVIIILLSTPILAFCKAPKLFTTSIHHYNEYLCTDIFLYRDGQYEISVSIESPGSDVFTDYIISYGNYKFLKSKLILNDTYNHFEMTFNYNNGYLVAEKTFICFKDLKFEEKQISATSEYKSSSSDIPTALESARSNYERKHKVDYDFKLGKYYIGLEGYNLTIKSNHNYELSLGDYILSKGTWERKKNELRLYDTALKHTFYLFISKNKLKFYVFQEMIGEKMVK